MMLNLIGACCCFIVSYVTFAFVTTMERPDDWREYALQFSLAGLVVSAFATGVAALAARSAPSVLGLLMRMDLALVALLLYDGRFGLVRHLRWGWGWVAGLPAWLRSRPRAIRGWIDNARQCWRARVDRMRGTPR